MPDSRGGSSIFFRRGCTRLLLYFNTNKPHSFFCRIPVVLENRRSSFFLGGGVRTPCTLPLDPPLADKASVRTYECMSALTALLPFYVPSDIVMCCNVDNNGEMVQRSFGHASKN